MMKFLLVLCLLACATAAPRESSDLGHEHRDLSESLQAFLEELRKLMKNGDPDKGIPVLDPLQLDSFAFNFEVPKTILFNMTAGEASMVGLSEFIATNVSITLVPMRLLFDFTLPVTLIKSNGYKFTGMVFGALPIYGEGKAHFEIGNIRFNGFGNVAVHTAGVYIKDLKIEVHIESFKSLTTGMLGGGDIDNVVNAMMGDLAPYFFNANSDILSKELSEYAVEFINKQLEGMSLKDLIDLITGGSSG